MFSESSGNSFCFMGVSSNSAVFVSDKDLSASSNMDPPEFGLLVRPPMKIHKGEGCETSTTPEEEEQELIIPVQAERDDKEEDRAADHEEADQKQHSVVLAPLRNLKLEIPFSYDGWEEDDSEEGLKTPTSSDHKIPVILECPGAPRKRKSRPAAKKRKEYDCRQQEIVPDLLWQELESLFPTDLVLDLGAAGGKIKRVKQYCPAGSAT